MKTENKKCPYCGHKYFRILNDSNKNHRSFYCACRNCSATGPRAINIDDAIRKYNNRMDNDEMEKEENLMCTCESLAYYGDSFLMLQVDPECKQHGRKKSDQSKYADRVPLLELFAKIMSAEWVPSSKVSADYFATYVMENGEEGYFYARKAVP